MSAALTGSPTTNYSYDLNGDNTGFTYSDSSPGTTYSYNNRGQLTGITSAGNTPVTLTYAGPTNDQLLTVAAGTTTVALANGPLGVSAIATTASGTDYITRDPSGQLISYRPAAGGHQYYWTGLQSSQTPSVIGVADDTGNHSAFYHYEAFGQITSNSDTTSPAGPFRFLGQIDLDSLNPAIHTSGLLHLGARYYDPILARFTQTDPVTHTTAPNTASPYTYAGGDPISHADPSGRNFLSDAYDTVSGAVEDAYDYTNEITAGIQASVISNPGCTGSIVSFVTGGVEAATSIALAPESAGATVVGVTSGIGLIGTGLQSVGSC